MGQRYGPAPSLAARRGSIHDVDVPDQTAGAGFVSLEPLEGGWSGETFVAEAGGERTVVRIYSGRRGPEAPAVDAAVLAYAAGVVPGVPPVLEVRRADPGRGVPGLLVTGFLPGERGDLVLPGLDAAEAARAGEALGLVLVALAGTALPRGGAFVDASLSIGAHPAPYDADGMLELVEVLLAATGSRLRDLRADEQATLRTLAREAQDLLDEVPQHCLVHGDLNPKNLLLQRGEGGPAVSGVLDWEFAHAGHPAADLGNLLRFERRPAFHDAVAATYAERRGLDVAHALDLARAADLLALVELASRAGSSPPADRALGRLRAVLATGDLHATEA
ncbi:Phosphotransferase enzyme family protein [Nocardioides dokdonensis FR1436]|uniref:Phosphotransferase enzyme family protein n=1 Tax=Nocardioides dokdonensis FR1436 TaxID=1300347 RepID=A0A1A9GR02_9ACTN|nr:aminoglycoside phosphotransferase family protein [Nocardioides dokdonensis]ANH40062.1 Phosphotransferase enzyme family protein [Nocardioides dokdonensis FR1436]